MFSVAGFLCQTCFRTLRGYDLLVIEDPTDLFLLFGRALRSEFWCCGDDGECSAQDVAGRWACVEVHIFGFGA